MDDKIINYDMSNEQLILSNSMQSRQILRKTILILNANNFVGKRHKVIVVALKKLEENDLEFNEDTFKQLVIGDFGGFEYIRKLINSFEINPNIDAHIEKQLEISKRYLLKTDSLEELFSKLDNKNETVESIVNYLEKMKTELRLSTYQNQITSGDEFRKEYINILKQRTLEEEFIGFGIPELDSKLSEGLARKKITIVAARTSMGKTTYIANAIDEWREKKKKVLICSLESGREAILDSIVARKLNIHMSELVKYTKNLKPETKIQIRDLVNSVLDDNYIHFWKEEIPLTLDKVIQVCENNNYDICVIDLFEKLKDVKVEGPGRNIDDKLDQLQDGAKRANVSMLITSQIRRIHTNAKVKNLKPNLEDIKNAGKYEEIADLIILLYRSHYYNRNTRDVIEQIVAKQRRGERGFSVFNEFIGKYAKIGKATTDPEVDGDGIYDDDE